MGPSRRPAQPRSLRNQLGRSALNMYDCSTCCGGVRPRCAGWTDRAQDTLLPSGPVAVPPTFPPQAGGRMLARHWGAPARCGTVAGDSEGRVRARARIPDDRWLGRLGFDRRRRRWFRLPPGVTAGEPEHQQHQYRVAASSVRHGPAPHRCGARPQARTARPRDKVLTSRSGARRRLDSEGAPGFGAAPSQRDNRRSRRQRPSAATPH
jgi:hypothetical protein